MTLKEYADVLRAIDRAPDSDGHYQSKSTGLTGYWAEYTVDGKLFRYSVSNTEGPVFPVHVVNAIENGKCQRAKPYKGSGFEATINFDGHSYMLTMYS
jgi:hypothetical protein